MATPRKIIKDVTKNRIDLSDYLIHFTRSNDTATAFDNLKSIINEGHLRCGWAERCGKRTVFGKTPAVCFTEMPLFSFYNYVLNRDNTKKVDFYGIALPKQNLFRVGARNVIYGTTKQSEDEKKSTDGSWKIDNLPEDELYRYMLTKIKDTNDWTHEREWRWTNKFGYSNGDYLPIWSPDRNENFTCNEGQIFIIVKEKGQIKDIQKLFKNFIDDSKFNKYNAQRTYILSLDNLLSIDDLSHDNSDFLTLLKNDITVKAM